MINEQMEFSEIERLSKIALDVGDTDRLEEILLPLLREDDRTRSAKENLFIYRSLGRMYLEESSQEEALEAYRQAHSFDPRDMESLELLVDEELKKAPSEMDSKLLMDILIFHRESLKNNLVMRVFKAVGDAHAQKEELDKAREYYEKALDVRPGDMDLIQALINVSEASGNETAIRKSREKLLNLLTSPESRAAVLVSIGDDYMNSQKNEKLALEMYEEALAECSQSVAALQRVLVVSQHEEDWERALGALDLLVKVSAESDEKCKYLLKMAWIYKEKLSNTTRAIQLFNDVLDIQPMQVEVFQGMITMLQERDDFLGIERNYEMMIERQRNITPVNTKLLAALCKNLGDLRLKQLNNIPGAAQAYKVVSELNPDNVKFHVLLAKLYAIADDTLEDAVFENREILRLAPDHLESVTDLATCYRRLERYDEALCTYRVLNVLGLGSEEGNAIVQKFASMELPEIRTFLSEEEWKLIRPDTLDMNIIKMLSICTPYIVKWFEDSPEQHGIRERDARIELTDTMVFANTLRSQARIIGVSDNVDVYRHDKYPGIMNAYFTRNSLLVNTNFLGSRYTEREIAFTIAKSLMLLRPELYLVQRGKRVIELIILTIFKVVRPRLNIELDDNQTKLAQELSRRLSVVESKRLMDCVDTLAKRGGKLNMVLFMESVEDFCNRVGLLFCDDPSSIENMLNVESRPISNRAVRDRVGSLLVWAMSEDYMKLRQKLKIAIELD